MPLIGIETYPDNGVLLIRARWGVVAIWVVAIVFVGRLLLA